jgi:hypothetical protein
MPTVAEVLKAANIADDVAAGLPPDVVKALTGYVADAETKLSSAAQEALKAEEFRRQAELDKVEIVDYVDRYGTSLTKMAGVEAKNKALMAYLESLKSQGVVTVPDELIAGETPGRRAAVPGSPAEGGNAVDEKKILGRVGSVMSQWFDANNEHIRLYGVPIPDQSEALALEADRARKPLGQYAAEKYKFSDKRQEVAAAETKKREDVIRKEEREKIEREHAESNGSNPNLRSGEGSRQPYIPKIKSDDFHKADGNVPQRDRLARMKEKIHADVQAARSA